MVVPSRKGTPGQGAYRKRRFAQAPNAGVAKGPLRDLTARGFDCLTWPRVVRRKGREDCVGLVKIWQCRCGAAELSSTMTPQCFQSPQTQVFSWCVKSFLSARRKALQGTLDWCHVHPEHGYSRGREGGGGRGRGRRRGRGRKR